MLILPYICVQFLPLLCPVLVYHFTAGADIVISGRKTIEGEKEKINVPSAERNSSRKEAILDIINKRENSFLAVCKLYRASVLRDNNIRFAEGIRFEDMVFSFSANAVCNSVAYCPDVSYVYCVRSGSLSETIDELLIQDYLKAISLVLRALAENDMLESLKTHLHFYVLEALYRTNMWFLKDANRALDDFVYCSDHLVKIIRALKLSKEPAEDVLRIVNSVLENN